MSKRYEHTGAIHNFNAPLEVVPWLMHRVRPGSVLDVGCGTGTWLKVFSDNRVMDYLGIDSDEVQADSLTIPPDHFMAKDLRHQIDLQRKYDLVISLEVAEHLDESCADQFVNTLTSHAGVILFSAAVPGQGGQHHVNEQWPDYWEKKFNRNGFYLHDEIRAHFWNNEKVDWWYRQNMFLVTTEPTTSRPLSLVHPELLRRSMTDLKQYADSVATGRQGLWVSLKIALNAVGFKLRSLLGIR